MNVYVTIVTITTHPPSITVAVVTLIRQARFCAVEKRIFAFWWSLQFTAIEAVRISAIRFSVSTVFTVLAHAPAIT
jgi:hypothetical protein